MPPRSRLRPPCECGPAVVHYRSSHRSCLHRPVPVGATPAGDSVFSAVIERGPGWEGTAAPLPAPQAAAAVVAPVQTAALQANAPLSSFPNDSAAAVLATSPLLRCAPAAAVAVVVPAVASLASTATGVL